MFKKLVYMTALSLALASSPDAYSSMKCKVENYTIDNYGNFAGKVDLKKCNVDDLNKDKNLYIIKENLGFKNYSTALNIITPILGLYAPARQIISKYCATCLNPNNSFYKLVNYIKYNTENSIRNKIMKNILITIAFSNTIAILTGLCSILSLIGNWPGITISLVPAIIINLYIIANDCYYAAKYKCSTEQQLRDNILEENIAYLHALYDQNHSVRDCIFGITEDDKKLERKRVFEVVIQSGNLNRLYDEHYNLNTLIDACVSTRILFDNGANISVLINSGAPITRLIRDGITIQQLLNSEITIKQLLNNGITVRQLLDNQVNAVQLYSSGVSAAMLYDAGVTIELAEGIQTQSSYKTSLLKDLRKHLRRRSI